MRCRAAVGVNDDFASSKPGIAIGTSYNKAPGRIYVKLIVIAHPALGKGFENRLEGFIAPGPQTWRRRLALFEHADDLSGEHKSVSSFT